MNRFFSLLSEIKSFLYFVFMFNFGMVVVHPICYTAALLRSKHIILVVQQFTLGMKMESDPNDSVLFKSCMSGPVYWSPLRALAKVLQTAGGPASPLSRLLVPRGAATALWLVLWNPGPSLFQPIGSLSYLESLKCEGTFSRVKK